ncbi:MAG TPA: PadR family transcriptional regulator [Nitrososphaerales archaeon]|nr:PadR family transcriptional regulator [Nitrososphaerales archaeon]
MSERKPRRIRPDSPPLTELKGAPRGLLLHYILHSISVKPKHGYEILQDIEGKTDGAWRPGVGSVYPVLKKLLASGYIETDERGSMDNRRVYSITPKGTEEVKERGEMFATSWQRWLAMRRLFYDLLDPAGFSNMFVEGSRKQFEMAKELMEARRDSMSRNEMDFMLREYSLNLERQLDWTQGRIRELRANQASGRLR